MSSEGKQYGTPFLNTSLTTSMHRKLPGQARRTDRGVCGASCSFRIDGAIVAFAALHPHSDTPVDGSGSAAARPTAPSHLGQSIRTTKIKLSPSSTSSATTSCSSFAPPSIRPSPPPATEAAHPSLSRSPA